MAGLFSKKSKKEKEEKAAAAKNAAAVAAATAATSNLAPSATTTTSGGNGSIASSTTMAPPPNSGGKQQLTNNNATNLNNNSTVLTSTTLSMTPTLSSTSSVPAHLRENSSASLDYSPQQQQQQQQQQLNNKSSTDSDKRMYHLQQQQHQHQFQQHPTLQQQQQLQTNSNGGGTGSNLVSASSISTHNSFAHLSSSNGPWISAQVMSTSPFPRFSHTASYVQTGTDIYVFGGVVKGTAQRDMHVIDSRKLSSSLSPFSSFFFSTVDTNPHKHHAYIHTLSFHEDPCLLVPIVPSKTISFFGYSWPLVNEKKGHEEGQYRSATVNRRETKQTHAQQELTHNETND